ncbi:MAG: hypothetical protein SAMD01599839_17040 [Rectinema sp.]
MSAQNPRSMSMTRSLYKSILCSSKYQTPTLRSARRWKLWARPYACANINDTENTGAVAQYVILD